MIVTPDASVLLKWVLPSQDEQDSDLALSLRDEAVAGLVDLVVPQLWIYEVGNTLARRFPDHAGEALTSLADFGLTEAHDWTRDGGLGQLAWPPRTRWPSTTPRTMPWPWCTAVCS